jgi:peptidyl-dipeptidase A
MEKPIYTFLAVLPIVLFVFSCHTQLPYSLSEEGFQIFLNEYEQAIEPIMTKHNQAQWDAYITGKDEFFKTSTKLSLQIDQIHQDSQNFHYLNELQKAEVLVNPILVRQLEILYSFYLSKQIDRDLNKQITEISSKIEKIYANFRTRIEDKIYSDNEVTKILQNEKNLELRELIWRAQKGLGDEVAPDLINLAKLRNQAAKKLGFKNYYYMAMKLNELEPREVEAVFDELFSLTQKPFDQLHSEIEAEFSERYGINNSEIRPWHYEDLFAQSAPSIFEIKLDKYYENVDIPDIASLFYLSTGIPVDDILQSSDLYEREGKSQHAFSFFIDRKDDIRILCNIVPNERWMGTMLHELGHAIYDKYLDPDLPFLLRESAHPFTTEGVAMFFGSYSSNANWMKEALQISAAQVKKIETVSRENLRMSKLVFARWSMVVLNFEKRFYENPDQDLNTLWWDLVEKYQKIKRPDTPAGNEWATKLHIATYPVYYQNYQLGELFASQILNYVAEKYYPGSELDQVTFWKNQEAGEYLKQKVFKPGKQLPWNEMIKDATGETLSAKFFVSQYVSNK